MDFLLEEEKEEPEEERRWGCLIFLLVLLGILLLNLLLSFQQAAAAGMLPASILSGKVADYSADSQQLPPVAINFQIVEDVIGDQDPTNVPQRVETVQAALQTPVPTAVPSPSATSSLLDPTSTSPPISVSTNTAVPPSGTPIVTATFFLFTQTATVPDANPTDAATLQPAETISVPTDIQPASTATKLPTATYTPLPTADSPDDACSAIKLTNFNVSGQEVTWSVSNGSQITIQITEIFLDWPSSNEELTKIELGGDAIWDQKDSNPPTHIQSEWKEDTNRTIEAGQGVLLLFLFGNEAVLNGYELEMSFDNGCTIRAEK